MTISTRQLIRPVYSCATLMIEPAPPVNLNEQIQSVILGTPFVNHRALKAHANCGTVTLSGRVDSYYEKQMAQEVLRTIEGVESIDNQLIVGVKDKKSV